MTPGKTTKEDYSSGSGLRPLAFVFSRLPVTGWVQEHDDELHALPQYKALLDLLIADPQLAPLLGRSELARGPA
jgi:hypothetical protein